MPTVNMERLIALLTQLVSTIQSLQNIMESEHESLWNVSSQSVAQFAEQKSPIVNTLSELENQLLSTLNITNASTLHANMAQLIAEPNSNPQLKTLWEQLVEHTSRCRDLNRITGGTLHTLMEQSRRKMEVIFGEGPSTKTYDDEGRMS